MQFAQDCQNIDADNMSVIQYFYFFKEINSLRIEND